MCRLSNPYLTSYSVLSYSVFLPPLKSWGEHCVEFSYHMYGYHINTLALFHDNYSKSRDIVWSKRGEQGNRWITARATVSLRYHDRVGRIIGYSHCSSDYESFS